MSDDPKVPWLTTFEASLPDDLKAYVTYSNSPMSRATVKLIPWLGNFVDALFALPAEEWRKKWLSEFLQELSTRLDRLEDVGGVVGVGPSPEWKEFVWQILQDARKTRSDIKRQCFANLIANQAQKRANWNEVEIASSLLNQMSEAHIAVLITIVRAEKWKALESKPVVSIVKNDTSFGDPPPTSIEASCPELNISLIQMVCAQLLGHGLVYDEGLGRYGGMPMRFLAATDVGKWLLNWISDPSKKLQ